MVIDSTGRRALPGFDPVLIELEHLDPDTGAS